VEVTAQAVKDLREKTGAGFKDCQNALRETNGDVKAAMGWLNERGLKKAEKVTGREAKQGLGVSYVHQDRIGALVEISCETDFVARTEDFQTLAKSIAQQVAAVGPTYIMLSDVPPEVLSEKQGEMDEAGLKRWYEESVLMEQALIRDPKQKVSDLIVQAKAKLGENILVRRFTRYELGK